MEHALTTTAFTLDGYRILQTLGVVRGITVRSRNIFGTIGGSLHGLPDEQQIVHGPVMERRVVGGAGGYALG